MIGHLIAGLFDGLLHLLAELLGRTEQSGGNQREHGPELGQIILHRRSGDRERNGSPHLEQAGERF